MRTVTAMARNACVIRYRLDHGWGWLRIALATADSYLYAGAIFLVVSTAFGRGGSDRYFLIVLGIVGLRWTLSCLATADTLASLAALMAREVRAARLHALVYLMAPPTLVCLGSLAVFVAASQVFGSGVNSLAGLVWFPALFGIHLVFNIAGVLLVGEAFRHGWLTSVAPVLVAATLVWFVSPVMYRFDDLDVAAAALLTSWSPGSHIIAAYQNCFWFGLPFSREILPGAAAIAGAVALALLFWPDRRAAGTAAVGLPALSGRLTLVVDPETLLDDASLQRARAAGWTVHQPFRTPPRGLSGQDWSYLVHALRWPRRGGNAAAAEFVRRVEADAGIGDLFRRAMTLYPEAAADRLAAALALAGDGGGARDRRLLLVRLFDALPRAQVPTRWAWLAGCSRDRDAATIAVLSTRLLVPGEGAEGNFVLLRGAGTPVSGTIAEALPAAYADYLEAASHAMPGEAAAADQSPKSS